MALQNSGAVVQRPLNFRGSPPDMATGEAEACPRNWFLYSQGRAPRIHDVTWNHLRADTRAHHMRWLVQLKSMPNELLELPLASACIRMILDTARVRGWKWATTAKAFAAVAGALRDLPLYSNQKRGILIRDDPEWRSAFSTVQRYVKESIPDPPPYMTHEEVAQIVKELRLSKPLAALFLALMWKFAARGVDISTLRCKDVTLFQTTQSRPTTQDNGEEEEGARSHHPVVVDVSTFNTHISDSGGVPVTLTIRMGKGAKSRGPYAVPSMLTRELYGMLQQLLARKRPSEVLFAPHVEQLRSQIHAALDKVRPGAGLPSVRKGALRCMAEAGVSVKNLMILSGHTKQATLMRYLGYGEQPTAEEEAARASASRALQLL